MGGFGMSMADLSSVNLRKTTQKGTGAPAPRPMGMGLGPGFNPAAIKLKKTAAGPSQGAKPKEQPQGEEQKPVDFRANLRKAKGQGFFPPPLTGGQVMDLRAGLRKTTPGGAGKGGAAEEAKKSENGQFDFRANLRKTGLPKAAEKTPDEQQQQK